VVTTSGEPVGRVTDVRHFGQDLLVIEPGPAGSSAEPLAGPGRASPDRASPDRASPDQAGPDQAGPGLAGPARPGRGPGGPALAARGRARGAPDGELLIPFVAAIVPEVDVAAGRLVIDPPPGLLELATGEPGQGPAAGS
jgi:16S rRNA processing protein RimM